MSLAEQVGPDLAPFVRWLAEGGDWSVRDVIDVLADPKGWEPEFAEWQSEMMPRPTLDELEGEERANR